MLLLCIKFSSVLLAISLCGCTIYLIFFVHGNQVLSNLATVIVSSLYLLQNSLHPGADLGFPTGGYSRTQMQGSGSAAPKHWKGFNFIMNKTWSTDPHYYHLMPSLSWNFCNAEIQWCLDHSLSILIES